jgi:NADP-dependent 3-hydroxy acid dehydrogenase YdfG
MTISSEESKASSGHIAYTAKQDHCSVLEKLVRPLEIVIVTGAAHGIGAAVAARCHLVNNHSTRR